MALLLGEVAVRLLSDEGPIYTFRDQEIGRRFTRSWEGDCYVEEAGRVVHLRFNREGMRDRDWPTAKPVGQIRVAVLGDSMVAALATDEPRRFSAFGVSDLATDVVHALVFRGAECHSMLSGSLPVVPEVDVQNWGVPGSSPALAVRLFEERVRAYVPDVVALVWFVGNDLSDDWQPLGGRRIAAADLDADGALRWLPFDDESSPASEWLARHSRLYVWQKRMLARLGQDAEPADLRPGLRAFDTSEVPVLRDAWKLAEQVLLRFASQARAAGSEPVLLVLPCAEQVYDDLWERTGERARSLGWRLERGHPSRRLAEIAARADMPCVDVGERLAAGPTRRRLERPADWIFLNGTGHLNDAGHAIVREQLASAVGRALLDPP